jgi:hypothetical protein
MGGIVSLSRSNQYLESINHLKSEGWYRSKRGGARTDAERTAYATSPGSISSWRTSKHHQGAGKLRILFIGDVVGRSGLDAIAEHLRNAILE